MRPGPRPGLYLCRRRRGRSRVARSLVPSMPPRQQPPPLPPVSTSERTTGRRRRTRHRRSARSWSSPQEHAGHASGREWTRVVSPRRGWTRYAHSKPVFPHATSQPFKYVVASQKLCMCFFLILFFVVVPMPPPSPRPRLLAGQAPTRARTLQLLVQKQREVPRLGLGQRISVVDRRQDRIPVAAPPLVPAPRRRLTFARHPRPAPQLKE